MFRPLFGQGHGGWYGHDMIAIDDRDVEGNSVDWPELEDAKAACACHIELRKTMNPWDAAEQVWRELRKEAQAEAAAIESAANHVEVG
jgi:hypothetical protein